MFRKTTSGPAPELCCGREFTNETCSDAIDNDGNGFTDCADFGCRNGPYVSVCDGSELVPTELCVNGTDDDDDGRVDCADPDCRMDGACIGELNCSDGIDDEGDGFADCDDSECLSAPACVSDEDTLAKCMDGVDNDGDTYTDCADFSCQDDPAIVMYCESLAEDTVEACSDSIDNDGNGFTDCEDFSCSASDVPAVAALCETTGGDAEDTLAKCMDGIDNDANGFLDCADFSCSRSLDAAIAAHCATTAEEGFERCTDGIDNDGNGFADCDDNSCVPTVAATEEDRMLLRLCEAEFEVCKDGIDNEGDGFPDCQDFSCRGARTFGGPLQVTAPCLEAALGPGDGIPDAVLLNWQMTDPALSSITEDEAIIQVVIANCSDGVDNDQDGFVDCEDWDCNWHPTLRGLCESRAGGSLVCD
ncbi:MAG: hypothetical protein JRH11_18945 [Deltaproteobacteria bacterium]|nr:hypothetical protein [Deltaproteobacteria bacterium]